MGKYENKPYEGIEDLLKHLKAAGVHCYVATSKPETTAREILKKFGLTQYFDCIAGASEDSSRDSKEKVIRYLFTMVKDIHSAVMVGDTVFDIIGARETGVDAIGVTWGFGNVEEMKETGARNIVSNCSELEDVILGVC